MGLDPESIAQRAEMIYRLRIMRCETRSIDRSDKCDIKSVKFRKIKDFSIVTQSVDPESKQALSIG